MPVKLNPNFVPLDKKIASVVAGIKPGEGLTLMEFAAAIGRSTSQALKICKERKIGRKIFAEERHQWIVMNPRDLKKYADQS